MLSAPRRALASLAASLAVLMPPAAALSQTAAPAQGASLVEQLKGPDTPASDFDVAALRQRAVDRAKSRTDPVAQRRPPIAPQLVKLPQVEFSVVFDPDTSIIRPQSYQAIGRLADALTDPRLRPYVFLVVDHTESGGNRNDNLTLSQKRADALRLVLANGFRVAPNQLQALGLGEEQLLDASKPSAPANARVQIVTIGTVPPQEPTAAKQPAKKGPAKKKR